MGERPNIVYIMADDMGYGDVGCYNPDSKIPTPNMDRVAAEGVRFTDAHSSSAVCTPSRYSVLAGRYCWRTWLKKWVGGGFMPPLIEPSRETLASMLSKQGYATAAVGKWHVGMEWPAPPGVVLDTDSWEDTGQVDFSQPIRRGPTTFGFDSFFGIAGSLDMPPYCFVENDRTVGIPDIEKDPYNAQQRRGTMTPGWVDSECDPTFARKAVEFILGRADEPERPFFLYLTPAAPHRPCVPPKFAWGKSHAGPRGDSVWLVDWIVGQVMDALDRIGAADDTLLIVTSDNGARPCDVDGILHGHKSCGDLRGYKADIWDGGHREPFLVRWPARIRPGRACDQLVCLSDVMATTADILGVPLGPDAAEDSISFLPALRDQPSAQPMRQDVVHHSGNGMFSLRRGPWKLILGLGSGGFSYPKTGQRVPGGPPGQLYNMQSDPAENYNLWDQHPRVVAELTALLQRYQDAGRSARLD